jgi:PAS domain S-box-containing protein
MVALPEQNQPTFDDLKLLSEASELLTLLDLDGVMERVINLMAEAVGATKASLFLHGEDNDIDWNHLFLSRELKPDETIQVVRQVLTEGLAGWVVRERRATIVYDTEADERWHIFPNDTLTVRSVLCVPFMYNNQVLAVLTLVHNQPYHFNDYHLRMMSIVANQATVAVRNAQLFNRMQAQQYQLEAVLQAIPDALLVLDDQNCIWVANPPALQLLGFNSLNEAIGRSLSDVPHIEDSVIEPILEVTKGPAQRGDEQVFEKRSERFKKDFLITVSIWGNPSQNRMGYVVVMRDITTLRDLNRFKSEMMQVASHDLRSPLALIVGYCDLIGLDTPPEQAAIHEYLAVIRRSTDRMNALLEALLRAEQVRNSPLELHEHIKARELVQKVIAALTPAAQQKEIQLWEELNVDEGLEIVADPVLIREAMENYLSNAIKYTPPKGFITISAQVRDNRFEFTVEDDGIGIPQEHVHRVFDAFFRAKQSGAEKVDGSGLGLSIVKTVVERHKGEVWVESKEGEGSRFGFWLPL